MSQTYTAIKQVSLLQILIGLVNEHALFFLNKSYNSKI